MASAKQAADEIVQIDPNNLDKECISLPSQYLRYAFLSGEAKRDVDEAKAACDVVKAEMAGAIRSDPKKFGLEKVTETSLAAMVAVTSGVKHAEELLRKARHRYEMAQAVVWALEHKKRSLTLLVELHGLGYFSDVKMTAEGKDAVQKMTRGRSVKKRGDNDTD